jgi:predicted transcriptional regulator
MQNPLKEYLTRHNMSVYAFIKKSGILYTTIIRILSGSRPYTKTVSLICKATDGELTPEDFGCLVIEGKVVRAGGRLAKKVFIIAQDGKQITRAGLNIKESTD